MALLKRKRSGLSDPMSVVTNFVNACNRHDAEGVSACLHPDFDSIQPMYPSRNFRGADQVRRNWQAIFDAEPGFRLTVLRTAAADSTVWLELHGAGRDAEVAGVFVMGIQGDRIRWARIYSALVEGSPVLTEEGTAPAPAPLREVPPLKEAAGSDEAAAVAVATADAAPEMEDPIAPVVDIDIDGNGRSFRRRSRRKGGAEPVVAQDPVLEEAAAALEPEREPEAESAPVSAAAGAAADSIDPETLVDPERLIGSHPLPGPEKTHEPDAPADPGSDYDLKQALAGSAIAAAPEAAVQPRETEQPEETVQPEETEQPEETVAPEPVVAIVEEPVMAGVVEPVMAVVLQPEAAVDPEAAVEPDVPEAKPSTPVDAAAGDAGPPPEPKGRKGRLRRG